MIKVRIIIVAALLAVSVAVPQAAWAAVPQTAKGPNMINPS